MNDFPREHLLRPPDAAESPLLSARVPAARAGNTQRNAIRFRQFAPAGAQRVGELDFTQVAGG